MTRTSREIKLTQEERHKLAAFTRSGKRSAKLLKRAEIILARDTSEGRNPAKEADIAGYIGVSRQTIQNVKKDFLTSRDLSAFLQRKKRETPPVPPKVTGEVQARIIALACSQPPKDLLNNNLRNMMLIQNIIPAFKWSKASQRNSFVFLICD
jgi:hypothetical protein